MKLSLPIAALIVFSAASTVGLGELPFCSDTDSGIAETSRGVCSSTSLNFSDRCSGHFLLEGYCKKDSSCGFKAIDCNRFCKGQNSGQAGICDNGACACSASPLPACSDSDNGMEPFSSGICSVTRNGKTENFGDRCISQNFLLERGCSRGSDFCQARFLNCDSECKKADRNSLGLCTSNACSCAPSQKGPKIVISEVYYDPPDETDEFVELFVENASMLLNVSGWKITDFDNNNITLPFISGLGKSDYIVIYTGNGTNDTDASDGKAAIYRRRGSGIWTNTGDEVGLYDREGKIHDFMRYEEGNGDPVLANWPSSDNGPAAPEGESVQLNGTDMDSGVNWISALPSPGGPIIFKTLYDDFSGNSLNLTKWNESTDFAFTDMHGINTTEGAYHNSQIETVSPGTTTFLTMNRLIQATERLEFDIKYVSGEGNNIFYYYFNGIAPQHLFNCSNCGTIGFWNTNGSIGTDFGIYHFKIEFYQTGVYWQIRKPDSTLFIANFTNSPILIAPYSVKFITATGHNGLVHFDYDNFTIVRL
ncbi:MAG: lamin tail domain-containing protein [Candidatus Aenigmarchaeota archaeon]|nr:lamin tail domain-containing protein [Candidatus Aenigmarchaeota archaeon]